MLRIVITSTCLICLAVAQAAPSFAPDASATPGPKPTALTDTTRIADVELIEPVRASRGTQSSEAPPSTLTARMNAALRGERRAPPRARKGPPEALSPRTWTCGNWQELWQGRGSARTCEWR